MLKDVKSLEKRVTKIYKKFNKIAIEEIYDLDRTFLEFLVPRLKELYKRVRTTSKDTEWLSNINSLISMGDTLIKSKKSNKSIEILNSAVVVTSNKVSIDNITEEEVLKVLDGANAEYLNREAFKKLLHKVLFTLNF